MKILFAVLFLVSGTIDSPTENRISLLKTDQFEVTLESSILKEKFISALYSKEEKKISFVTKDNLRSILVYNDSEELELVLPVMADRVSIGESLFDSGVYKLGFNFENEKEITFADMVMN